MSESDSSNLIKYQDITSPCDEYELARDGITLKRNFLTKKKLDLLNTELDNLFEIPSFNGRISCKLLWKKNSIGYVKRILIPELTVKSINLLELAVDINNLLLEQNKLKTNPNCLAALEIIEEINPTPLFWHTDNREDMYRAFIYLKGGGIDSGAFQYMVGTHKRDYYIEHKLSKTEINQLSNKIYIAKGNPGDLVIADTVGFHANKPRQEKRRIIRFELHPKVKDYPKSPICLPSFSLSEKIKMNLDLFDQECLGKRNNYVNNRDYSIASIKFAASDVLSEIFSRYKKRLLKKLNKFVEKILDRFKIS